MSISERKMVNKTKQTILSLLFITSCLLSSEAISSDISLTCSGLKKVAPESNHPRLQEHSFFLMFNPAEQRVYVYESYLSRIVFLSKGQGDKVKHFYNVRNDKDAYVISESFVNYDRDEKMIEFLHISKTDGDAGGGVTVVKGIKTNEQSSTIEQFRGICR